MNTQKQQGLTPYPTLSLPPKKENLSKLPPQYPQHPTSMKTLLHDHQPPLLTESITATAKCKLTTENAAANAELLSEKMATGHGPCTNHKKKSLDSSLKKLDRRLDKALNSREATHAFNVLRIKMEKDYRTKQSSDNQMYFDTRDNYVSPEDIRAKYKQICNSKEYVEAKESLL
jgi:hypothetical protein